MDGTPKLDGITDGIGTISWIGQVGLEDGTIDWSSYRLIG